MADNNNGENLTVTAKVPFGWVKKFARELGYGAFLFICTMGATWWNTTNLQRHAEDTQSKITNTQEDVNSLRGELEDCKRINNDLKKDIKTIKTLLGIDPNAGLMWNPSLTKKKKSVQP